MRSIIADTVRNGSRGTGTFCGSLYALFEGIFLSNNFKRTLALLLAALSLVVFAPGPDVQGDDVNVYNAMEFGSVGSIVAPSILIRELDLKKPPEEFDKPPILKNAFFETK